MIAKTNRIVYISASVFIFFICFYIFSYFNYFDPDLWGHLKFGEYVLINNTIPWKDIYSFVPTKPLWINHEWLCEVIFYKLFSLNAKGTILLLFKALICTFSVFIAWIFTTRKYNHWFLNGIIYFVIINAYYHCSVVRPQIFSFFFFSLLLLMIEYDHLKSKISYFCLPILFILWVNTHGGVMAGLLTVYLYSLIHFVIEIYKKQWQIKLFDFKPFLLPVILTLTLLITPYGVNYIPYIFEAISMKRPLISEWQSLFTPGTRFPYVYILLIITIIILIGNIKNYTLDNIYKLIFLLLFMGLSIKYYRHIPFFALACAYYLPYFIEKINFEALTKLPLQKFLSLNFINEKLKQYIIIVCLLVGSILYLTDSITLKDKFYYQLVASKTSHHGDYGYPIDLINFIKEHKLKGKMMVTFNWGEFVIYYLYPEIKVSVDGRYETVYPDSIVADNMTFIFAKPGWKEVLEKYNPDMIVVSQYDRVAKSLLKLKQWQLVYADKESMLFLKKK